MSRIARLLVGLYAWARNRWKPLAVLFFGVLLPLVGFGALAEDVWTEGGLPWDAPVLQWIHRFDTPTRVRAWMLITRLGYGYGTAPLAVGVFTVLLLRRQWTRARFFTFAVCGAVLLNAVAKLTFQRVRPGLWASPAPETGYSFPSGHAMSSAALVAALAVLAWPTRARWWVVVPGTLFVAMVGFSRMFLGVHYPSDVLAGWAASLAWVAGVAFLTFGRILQERKEPGG